MMKRRVVVTGLGAITPLGNTVPEFWAGVKEGKVGIAPITKFDTTEYKVKLAAEVKDFVAKDRMDFKAARRMEAFSQYAVAAAKEAFNDAGIDWRKRTPSGPASSSAPVSEACSRWSPATRRSRQRALTRSIP